MKKLISEAPAEARPLLEDARSYRLLQQISKQRGNQFVASGQTDVLRKMIVGIDPEILCPKVIKAGLHAKTAKERREVVRQWRHAIFADNFKKRGNNGVKLWNHLLKRLGIHEDAKCESAP